MTPQFSSSALNGGEILDTALGTHWIGGRVEPRVGWEAVKTKSYASRDTNPDRHYNDTFWATFSIFHNLRGNNR
jgi:hypothetical protein